MKKNHGKKYIFHAIFALALACLFIIPGSAHNIETPTEPVHPMNFGGSTIYVDDDNIAGPWDGTIDYPYRFIQDGIDHATAGDTVSVFAGTYTENVVVSKSLHLIGENKYSTIITGDGFGTVVKIIAGNITVSGFTIERCGGNPNNAGILVHTSDNLITDNVIQKNNYYGITILQGNCNTMYHNTFIDNTYQAFDNVAGSTWDGGYLLGGNYWNDYTGTDANEDGIGDIPYPTGNSSSDRYPLIHPYGSVLNKDTSEIFLTIQGAIADTDTLNGQTISVKNGVYCEHLTIDKSLYIRGENHYDGTILTGRHTGDVITISANDVIFEEFIIQHSGTAEYNAGIIIQAKNCSIMKCIVYENFQGIILKQSAKDATIAYNEVLKNGWNGIVIQSGCTGASLFENTISNNFYAGIAVFDASYNFIYHNNFLTNRYQAYDNAMNSWDDGYPSAGNYWSDYTGTDEDGDGIGDTPYIIPDGISKDRYPLMEPYTEGDTIPPKVTIVSPQNGFYLFGLRLLPWLFPRSTIIYGPVTIEVDALDARSGIDRVEFLLDNSPSPEFIDNTAPYSWQWSRPSFLFHRHSIIVVAFDKAGNPAFDMMDVLRYF